MDEGFDFIEGQPDRVLDLRQHTEDVTAENSLRPKNLNDFIGQAELKNKLEIFLGAAKQRGEAVE